MVSARYFPDVARTLPNQYSERAAAIGSASRSKEGLPAEPLANRGAG
jgi:hypothetical protein